MAEYITVYKITMSSGKSYYSLSPLNKGENRNIAGYDDGGHTYVLPEGFTVGTGYLERPAIYDNDGLTWKLISNKGDPALIEFRSLIINLKEYINENPL